MKSKACGWRTPQSARRAKPMKGYSTDVTLDYLNCVTTAASFKDFQRHKKDEHPKVNPLLSAEALPESSSLIDFKSFAHEYPGKMAALVAELRPEFQEYFAEYYLLEKTQKFIGQTHGCISTRVWQNLRIIERSIGAMILLGPQPTAERLRPILKKAGVDTTPYGSLTDMVVLYAKNQNYSLVAEKFYAPLPTIRKIFRPVIKTLLANKDVQAVAVGAYLRSITHQVSLTGAGLGKRYQARLDRVKTFKFDAPPSKNSPILTFGLAEGLQSTPWNMLEISSDHRMTQIYPTLLAHSKKLFAKHPGQIFAPVSDTGELIFGYIFARCKKPSIIKSLTRVRGISEIVSRYADDGSILKSVTVPHAEVQEMMAKYPLPAVPTIRPQDFVEILTGPAERYSGTVTKMNPATEALTVEVEFPTGKKFIVSADPSCVRLLPETPKKQRKFWGVRLG